MGIQPQHLTPSRSRIQLQDLTSRSLKDTTLETMEVADTIDKDTIKETRIQPKHLTSRIQPQHLTSRIQPKLLNTPRIQPMHLTSRSRRRSLGMEVSDTNDTEKWSPVPNIA